LASLHHQQKNDSDQDRRRGKAERHHHECKHLTALDLKEAATEPLPGQSPQVTATAKSAAG
jgi:hypothetical protein